MRRIVLGAVLIALLVMAVAPASGAAPSNANGNKVVVSFDETYPVVCEDGALEAHFSGWFQFKVFGGEGNPNLELWIFHLDTVYSNDAGDIWVWRDRGPDHYYINQAGELIYTVTGRSALNVIGHLVLNTTTGEITLQAGQTPFGGEPFESGPDDYACEMLL